MLQNSLNITGFSRHFDGTGEPSYGVFVPMSSDDVAITFNLSRTLGHKTLFDISPGQKGSGYILTGVIKFRFRAKKTKPLEGHFSVLCSLQIDVLVSGLTGYNVNTILNLNCISQHVTTT